MADNIHNRKLPRRCFEVSQGNVVAVKSEDEETKALEYCSNILEQCRDVNRQYTAGDLKNAMLSFSTLLMKDEDRKSTRLNSSHIH